MKFKLGVLLSIIVIISISVSMFYSLRSKTETVTFDSIKNFIGSEYGEVVFQEISEDLGESVYVLKDDLYNYVVTKNEGKFLSISRSSMADKALIEDLKYEEAEKIARNKISRFLKEQEYIDRFYLLDYVYDAESYNWNHEFYFRGIAKNDVRTGDKITVVLTREGELRLYRHFPGSAKVALTQEPQITKDDAVQIVIDDVLKKQLYMYTPNLKETLQKLTPEITLSVANTKGLGYDVKSGKSYLAYYISFDDVDIVIKEMVFLEDDPQYRTDSVRISYVVDTQSGKILSYRY